MFMLKNRSSVSANPRTDFDDALSQSIVMEVNQMVWISYGVVIVLTGMQLFA